MSTVKKAKVVMLPTNEKVINTKEYQLLLLNSLFWTSKIEIERYKEGWFFLNNSSNPNSCAITIPNVEIFKHQHLYIISDDEIKEGDYFLADNRLNTTSNKGLPNWVLCKCTKVKNSWVYCNEIPDEGHNGDWCKKIIATTDTSLYIHQKETISLPERVFYLPQPSQQFIQKYIEEYNRGNIITDVLVEYLENYTLEYYESAIENKRLAQKTNIKETLKVNPKDNTITIKKAKDSYTREEVENLIYTAMKDRCYTTIAEWKKWIEENL